MYRDPVKRSPKRGPYEPRIRKGTCPEMTPCMKSQAWAIPRLDIIIYIYPDPTHTFRVQADEDKG